MSSDLLVGVRGGTERARSDCFGQVAKLRIHSVQYADTYTDMRRVALNVAFV